MANYEAAVNLAFNTTGLDAFPRAEAAMREVGDAQKELAKQFTDGAVGANEFVAAATKLGKEMGRLEDFVDGLSKSTQEYADLQAKLGQMEAESAEAALRGAAVTARAKQDGVEAVGQFVKAIEDQKAAFIAETEALGQRARAYAQAERQREAADKAAAQAAGEAMRARIDAYARAERAEEAERVAAIQAMGERARAYAAEEEHIQKYVAAADREANARRWVSKQTTELNDLLEEMAEHERTAATATVQFTTAANKAGAGVAATGRAAGDSSYKWLLLSNAIQDASFGLSYATNNLPGIIQAFGGSAGLAGAAQFAAVGIDLLGRQIGPFASQAAKDLGLVEDASHKWVSTVKDAQDRLEALQSKTYKVGIDFDQIAQAERILESMQKRLSAFNAARSDNLTDEMARGAKDATYSYAGGSEALQKIVAEQNARKGVSFAAPADEERVRELQESIKGMQQYGTEDPFAIKRAEAELVKLKQQIDDANRDAAKLEVGAFLTGDPAAIQRMQRRVEDAPGAFNRVGPGGVTAGAAIRNLASTPEEMLRRIDADDEMKAQDESEARLSAAYKKRKAERAKDAKEEEAAQAILDKSERDWASNFAKFQNDEGPRKKAIEDQAKRVAPEFNDDLRSTMLEQIAKNRTDPTKQVPGLAAQTVPFLARRGVPEDLRGDVAKQIVQAVAEKVANEVLGQGQDVRAVANDLIRRDDRKDQSRLRGEATAARRDDHEALAGNLAGQFQARAGFNDDMAAKAGEAAAKLVEGGQSAEMAMVQVYNQMERAMQQVLQGQLRQQAQAEAAAGVLGQATMMLGEINNRTQQQGANIRQAQNNLRRGQKVRPSTIQFIP